MKESQTHTRLFHSHKFFLLAILGLFTEERQISLPFYTLHPVKPLPFIYVRFEKGTTFRAKPLIGLRTPTGGSAYSSKARSFPNKASFHEPSFLIHLVHCAPSFIIIGIPFCSSEFSVSEIRA